MKTQVRFFDLKNVSDLTVGQSTEKLILCDGLTSLDVLNLCVENSAHHVVQKSNLSAANEMNLSVQTTINPTVFFKFPLSVILGEELPSNETETKRTSYSHFLSEPTERNSVLGVLESTLTQHCKRQTLVSDITLAADELITNALFNAPYTNSTNENQNVERDFFKISVDPKKKPYFFTSIDEQRIIIGCTDFYGRLDVKKLIERIKLCYKNNPSEMMNFEPGGAGIGSFLIFESCVSYYVAVDPENLTTICCSFPIKMSAKERTTTPKNVHIIINPDLSSKT